MPATGNCRSEEHTSELQSLRHLVCRLLLEKTYWWRYEKKYKKTNFKQGKNVKAYDICDSSGKVAIDGFCPETHVEYYKKGSEPAKCNYHSNSYTKSYSNSNNYYTKKKYYSSTTTNASENQTTAKSGSKTTAKAKSNPDSKGSTKENNNKPTVKAKADTKSKTSGNSSKKNTSEE